MAKLKKMSTALQLKVTLREAKPAIWRRVWVPPDYDLSELHEIIVRSMGWTDSHLHQ